MKPAASSPLTLMLATSITTRTSSKAILTADADVSDLQIFFISRLPLCCRRCPLYSDSTRRPQAHRPQERLEACSSDQAQAWSRPHRILRRLLHPPDSHRPRPSDAQRTG